MAYIAGGAIRVLGAAVSTLLVEASIFESNAVRVPADGGDVDMTVRVNTGAFAVDDPQSGKPIWRINNGPVYGISWEQCRTASLRSEEVAAKGFPSSWTDLQCANVSYTGPDASYSRVVALAPGVHTLWTGIAMGPQQNTGWQQAWIELVDVIGPLYPTPPDTYVSPV